MHWLTVLFFVSGIPALLYQIVWQRALFTIFGVNVESVTVVVSAFMLGLGLGSLFGGWLSKQARVPLLVAFGCIELSIAAYGFVSLRLFGWVAESGTGQVFLMSFALVLLPTLLMGATLPLLVTHLVRLSGNVGDSVGLLYFSNTLGSAAACFVAALYAMREFGMSGTVLLAVSLNVCVGLSVLLLGRSSGVDVKATGTGEMPLRTGLALAAAAGFVSLGFEIVWYRVYSFVTGGSPRCFAFVLGSFLAGIAFGSLASRRVKLPIGFWILTGTLLSFASVPLLGWAVQSVDYRFTLVVVALAAGLMGAAFPLICHAAVPPDGDAGRRLSYLYLSNIAGSALGSFVLGFVLLDYLSLQQICLLLAGLGIVAGGLALGRWKAPAVCTLAVVAMLPQFSGLYEKLLYKGDPAAPFVDLVETRSGVVSTDVERHIFGGGAHDGVLSTNGMEQDSCIRPMSLSYFHPAPKDVLLVGMAGGAWSQIVASHPQVERATIVEINPGYLSVIARYPDVAPILRNPKATIVIDDGRRWMTQHKDRKFDAILMDTVQHWRAQATNLLSTEMMQLARGMLKPGGIVFYNTTYSDEAQKTGATVFPYAHRFGPFLAVSDSPLQLDETRWREALVRYGITGERLEEIVASARSIDPTGEEYLGMEGVESIRKRTRGAKVITDDNMATEWLR